jgi:PAS domain S-box-containing protein
MNKAFFLQLVFNASLLLTLALIYDLVAVRWRFGQASLRQVPVGIVIGSVGVIVMMASWKLQPGIVFDTRSILIGISGLFIGSVPTIIAMAITAAYRGLMGGAASGMGIAVILCSGAIGIAWRHWRRHVLADITWRELYLFGMVIHLAMLGCTFFLPAATRWQVLANIFLPVLLIYPVFTAVLGKLMVNRLKREQTNEKLRESEERYQNLAKISPVGIFRTDNNGATTYVNPMWSQISGLSFAEAMGDGWLKGVHPDDREHLGRDWQEAARMHKASFTDYRFLLPDGTVSWVMGRAIPETNLEDQIIGYVGTITDISERKQAEILEQAVYEIARAADKAKNLDDLYRSVHLIIKGLMPATNFFIALYDEKEDRVSFPYFVDEIDSPPVSRKQGKGLTDYVLRTGSTLLCDAAIEKELNRRGEAIKIGAPSSCWLGVPLKAKNKTIGVIALDNYSDPQAYGEREKEILEYVSSQVANAIERKQAETAIRSSLAEKEVLLKEVHHRVKNNLMTIIGLIKMQEAKAPDKNMNSLLKELEGRIRSMALVHESLHKSENLARIDLQYYIETLADHIRAQFGSERDIRFRVQAAGEEVDLNTAVPCGLILNELITNAYKHAFPDGRPARGEGPCKIDISVSREGDLLALTVADNGVGLPADLDWERSETLGLRLIKMLSHQIKGSIELDRSAGANFRLRFPFSSAPVRE